jgi:D-serine deaminase-like pyridoxal phosphate-dependent protein
MMIGRHISELETPALVIDLDKLDRNINKMAGYLKKADCNLRPHFKTNKCPAIAHRQLKAGAIGITCAKLGEAEVLAKSGVDNILIANQIVDKSKLLRLAGIARYANIIVAVDSEENIRDLSQAASGFSAKIGVLVEANVNSGRCGIQNKESLLRLTDKVSNLPGLIFKGLMGYEGHCVFIEDPVERERETDKAMDILVGYRNFLESKGYKIEIVSGGGTGTCRITPNRRGVTEIQAGSYVFMDSKYKTVQGLEFENSLSLMATVISRPYGNTVITDLGMKAATYEFGVPQIVEPEGVKLIKLTEEHGIAEIEASGKDVRVGDRVKIIPSHCCTTVNLHDKYYVASNDIVIAEWDIAARVRFV